MDMLFIEYFNNIWDLIIPNDILGIRYIIFFSLLLYFLKIKSRKILIIINLLFLFLITSLDYIIIFLIIISSAYILSFYITRYKKIIFSIFILLIIIFNLYRTYEIITPLILFSNAPIS